MRRSRFSPAISLRSRLSGFVANRLLAMNDPPVVWFRSRRSIHAGRHLLRKNAWTVAKAACTLEEEVQGQDLDHVVRVIMIEIGVMPESTPLDNGAEDCYSNP